MTRKYKPRNIGWIYIFSNPCFKYLKIGATRKHPNLRCYDLSKCTSIPFHFIVEHFVLVSEVEKQGKRIHAKLIQYRVAKEFYDIELGTAKLLFDLTLRKLSDDHDPVRKIAEIDLGEVNLEN